MTRHDKASRLRTRTRSTAALVLTLACGATILGQASSGAPGAMAATPEPPRCAELAGKAIPAWVITLPTNGGRVDSASVVTETVSGRAVTYCKVDASIFPIDRSAPDIRMRIGMPLDWNGKTMMFGGGGYNGTIPDIKQNVPFGDPDRPVPLARGYATFGSDSGHQASPTAEPSLDGSFGMNDEALRNFAAGDALRKTRDAAMFLMRHGYTSRPSQVYFAGGSTGGREALVVAQRWPNAFDGVISAYPAWNNTAEVLFLGHLTQLMSRPGAFPGVEKQTLLYNSVIEACDGLDGIEDKVVSNVRACDFDPRQLRCPEGIDTGPTCLSDPQIRSVKAASSRFAWHYKLASGETHYPGFPLLQGADMRTPFLGWGTSAPKNPMPTTSGYGMKYWEQWVKYFVTRDPDFNSLDLDPRRPGKWYRRISHLSTIQDRNNADLGPFMRSGGKLILLHGAADELVSHRSTNDYYRRVRGTVGPAKVRSFLRYYLIPGANHANFGAPAFAAQWDSLTALERWVEEGQAPPRRPVVKDGASATGRTRPLCEYPTWPRYRSGDPGSAASFECTRN